jgi:LL-diaminopimelate aminotransferase
MKSSKLPEGGTNLFQRIKVKCAEAEARGQILYRLSIGQPRGSALESARKAAAKAVLRDEESMHEYQDNGSPGVPNFAQNFVQEHVLTNVLGRNDISFLPIPGIKPMLGLIPMACGGIGRNRINMYTMTDPGYPTPAVQAEYLGMIHASLPTNPENQFLFSTDDIHADTTSLIMTNYPHNPSGQVATFGWWEKLCSFCSEYKIRLFNDAAYAILSHSSKACTLSEVAIHYCNLSWAEAFSASKVINNGTGWRIGAMCGSPDFIADIATIKGNTDSGFFAPAAAGVMAALANDRTSIELQRRVYEDRISMLKRWLDPCGMRLAVDPKAGFFTLWLSPAMAFGREIQDAEAFNDLMIDNTGVVGIPFGRYIRYAVTSSIEDWETKICESFNEAKVSY